MQLANGERVVTGERLIIGLSSSRSLGQTNGPYEFSLMGSHDYKK